MKKCCHCKVWKPLEDFHRSSAKKDGKQGTCKKCRLQQTTAWREANRERVRELARKRRAADPERFNRIARESKRRQPPEKRRAAFHAWAAQHREHLAEYDRTYKAAHREKYREYENARRARKLSQFVEHVDSQVVYDRSGGICGICGKSVARDAFEIDHIVPLVMGGEHSYANTQAAHRVCNTRKPRKHLG